MSVIYIVTFDSIFMGRRHTGTYELDMDRMTVSNIASDIIDGQFPDVKRVYEAIPGESCTDVTEDVAKLVAERCFADQDPISWELANWLQSVRGVSSTHGLEIE